MSYELGYTPANLKGIMVKNRISNKELSIALGVSIATISYWLSDVGSASHHGMPHKRWVGFIEQIDYFSDCKSGGGSWA